MVGHGRVSAKEDAHTIGVDSLRGSRHEGSRDSVSTVYALPSRISLYLPIASTYLYTGEWTWPFLG